MAESLEACTVELIDGIDITQLPLTPQEGFVLSRVVGRVAVAEIAALTGLPSAQLTETLVKLQRLGALRIFDVSGAIRQPRPASDRPRRKGSGRHGSVGSKRPMMAESGISSPPRDGGGRRPGSSPSHPATQTSSRPGSQPRVPATHPPSSRAQQAVPSQRPVASPPVTPPSPAPAYDPKLLDEEVDLPVERRKQILELQFRLEKCTHYEALGVSPDASRKEIRAAYFALSKSFHPDTMFRRELGSFKARMELVFKAITEAYDTLSRKNAREDYDAYLKLTAATRASERRLRESVQMEAVAIDEASTAAATRAEPATDDDSETLLPPPQAPGRMPSERARSMAKQAVADRLGRAIASSRASAPPPPASERPTSPVPEEREQRLKDLASSLRRHGKSASVESLEQRARQSEESGDIGAAQEYLRRAISVAPGRQDLQSEHTRLSTRLAQQLASDYEAQAELEEKNGKWSAAALSWSKVFAGRPDDAHAARRAALAMTRAGGDLRRAHHFARQAVLLDPQEVMNRITLGQIMLQIGLAKGARRELQAALGLDPRNEMVKNLLAELEG